MSAAFQLSPGQFRAYAAAVPSHSDAMRIIGPYELMYGEEGVAYPAPMERYSGEFARYVDDLDGTGYRQVPIWEEIWFSLEEDLKTDGVVFDCSGLISREHYLALFGFDVGAAVAFRDLFEGFERLRPRPALPLRLRAALERDFALGAIVTTRGGWISRGHYARVVVCERNSLDDHAPIFREFEGRLDHPPVYGSITEKRIRSLLDEELATNGLVRSRSGKISRVHYARLLRCEKSALTRFRYLFAEYERRHSVETGPLSRLSEMAEWLERRFSTRALVLRRGKIDRSEFIQHFRLVGSNYTVRFPPIRALLDGMDERVVLEGYVSASDTAAIARVKARLEQGAALNRCNLTVKRGALAAACGIAVHRLSIEPLASIINAYDLELLDAAKRSRIDPYLHGRVFPFSALIETWPRPFLENVGAGFKRLASNWKPGGTKSPYHALLRLLTWMGTSDHPSCTAVVEDARQFGRVRSESHWEDAVYAYRDAIVLSVRDGVIGKGTTVGMLKAMRRGVNILSEARIVPKLSLMLRSLKNATNHIKRLPSIVEARATSNSLHGELETVARTTLSEASRRFRNDVSLEESEIFIEVLRAEQASGRELPSDPARAIEAILNARLGALKDRAVDLIEIGKTKLDLGRVLLSEADIDPEEFLRVYFGKKLNFPARRQYLNTWFPVRWSTTEPAMRRSIANLLSLMTYVDHADLSIRPRSEMGLFFARRYRECGGPAAIEPLLAPTSDTVAAVLTLYLVESGANVPVGRELKAGSVERSEHAAYLQVTGHKNTARGKPIIVHFAEDDAVIDGIRWLEGANTRLRALAGAGSTRLFVAQTKRGVKPLTADWFTSWFKTFAKSVPGLELLHLTPNMLRPSVLLRAALNNDGRLQLAMALGQHRSEVAQRYVGRWPVHFLQDREIREFQDRLETLVVQSIADAAWLLGITVEAFDARIGALEDTGLGIFCRNNKGRPGQEGTPCQTLDCWRCVQALVVAEVDSIARLQLWQEALRSIEGDWIRDQPERWETVWLPWLILADVIEEKMVRGLIKIWNAAKERAAAMKADPLFVTPKPW